MPDAMLFEDYIRQQADRAVDGECMIPVDIAYGIADFVEKQRGIVEQMKTASGWISVKDRMPEDTDIYYVAIRNHGGLSFDLYIKELGAFKYYGDDVSHWMALQDTADLPEEVTGDAAEG